MRPAKLTVTTSNGVAFRVVLLRDGRSENFPYYGDHDVPTVEFYDLRYPHTPDGQFVARYFATTLTERDERGRVSLAGLDLVTSEPSWKIDPVTMVQIRNWLVRLGNWTPTPCPVCGGALRQWRDGEPDGDSTPRAACYDEACGYEY